MSLSLDKDRLKTMSAIVADAGQVFLASTVILFFTGLLTQVFLFRTF